MTYTWMSTSRAAVDASVINAVAAKLAAHDQLDERSVVTSYGITAHLAVFNGDGSVVESAAWIPAEGLCIDEQIDLLERVLTDLKQRRAS